MMTKKINGSFYTATIEKSRVVALDGTPLTFKVNIYCEEEILFKELIEHIGRFHNDRLKGDDVE